jgi:prefoldin subunit 5
MPFVTRTQEMDSLKAQAEYLEDMLETIQRRISELEGKIKDTNVQSG